MPIVFAAAKLDCRDGRGIWLGDSGAVAAVTPALKKVATDFATCDLG